MKNILIIGSTGQIGTELAMTLRKIYPTVVAGYIPAAPPKGELLESGPSEIVDITDPVQIAEVVRKYTERRRRGQAPARLEDRSRRTLQRPRGSTRRRLCRLYPQLYWLLWP